MLRMCVLLYCVQGTLRECRSIRGRNFTVTSLLRTTRMRSQLLGRVSGVVAVQTNKQTKIRKPGSWPCQSPVALLWVLWPPSAVEFNWCNVIKVHTHTKLHNNIHESKVHCGSAFEPGNWRLPHYSAPLVCILNFLGGLLVWHLYKQTNKQTWGVSYTKIHHIRQEHNWFSVSIMGLPLDSCRDICGTPYYCTPLVCVLILLGGLALWRILLGPFVTETCKEQQIESRHVTLCHISRSV